jgi:hypothetical protein
MILEHTQLLRGVTKIAAEVRGAELVASERRNTPSS